MSGRPTTLLAVALAIAVVLPAAPRPVAANDPPEAAGRSGSPKPSGQPGLLSSTDQLAVQDLASGVTAQELVESIFGSYGAISNVVYRGSDLAAGTFSGGSSSVGLSDGIVLGSGRVVDTLPPNEVGGVTTAHGLGGDADLNALADPGGQLGWTTRDAAVLEFDLVPHGGAIRIDYVFTSDEYNEWVNSSFNDVFGFFVNGRPITVLPGQLTATAINNVNGGNPLGQDATNPKYYRNNDLNDGGGQIATEMDGLTVPFTATVQVSPGQAVPVKLAIADTSDQALDSNVFIGRFDCGSQQMTETPYSDPANPSSGEGKVRMRYDPAFLVDRQRADYVDEAAAVAAAIQARAVQTLAGYASLGLSIPNDVTIEVVCEITAGIGPIQPERIAARGFTESVNTIKLRADFIREEFRSAVRLDFAGGAWKQPTRAWVNILDHELFHTIQHNHLPSNLSSLASYRLGGNGVSWEAGAVAGQDLVADADDFPGVHDEQGNLVAFHPASYLQEVANFFRAPSAVLQHSDDETSYEPAALLQYVGERFGTGATLEEAVGGFLESLITVLPIDTMQGIHLATGPRGWFDPKPDGYDAILDFYIAAYALPYPNVRPDQNRTYQILDTDVHHGDPDGPTGGSGTGQGQGYPRLNVPPASQLSSASPSTLAGSLDATVGRVWEIDLPAGAQRVSFEVETWTAEHPGRFALMTVDSSDLEVPAAGSLRMDAGSSPRAIDVAGRDRLVVAFLSPVATDYSLKASLVSTASISVVSVDEAISASPTVVRAHVRPRIDGRPHAGLTRSDFAVEVDGSAVSDMAVHPEGDDYRLVIRGPQLSAGTHLVEVGFAGLTASSNFSVVPGPEPGAPPEPSATAAAGSFGVMAEGQTASTTARVAAGASDGEFRIEWAGSEFDLRLISPSGRVITEGSTNPDVTLDQGANWSELSVATPEPGDWVVEAHGVSVETPQEVEYRVVERGTSLQGEWSVTSEGTAGTSLLVQVTMLDAGLPVAGAQVIATVTDPSGVSREFPLFDRGASVDGGAGDGTYGAEIWATDLAGSYTIEVRAETEAFARYLSTTVALADKVDTDGDAVADAAETRLGLDPADPSDGGLDPDRDGLTIAAELRQGTDPWLGDTDGGGERDDSELARGVNPRVPDDDAALPRVLLSATAADGNLVNVVVGTSDGSGQVRLLRQSAAGRTDLGLFAGGGQAIVDGPLPSGTYSYVAWSEDASGVIGVEQMTQPIEVAADVTAPVARMEVNGGKWVTSDPAVVVTFSDLSEPAAEMRIAQTEDALAQAGWVPFEPVTTFSLGATDGPHVVHAQLRDAGGLASAVLSQLIDLDRVAPTSTLASAVTVTRSPAVELTYAAGDASSEVIGIDVFVRHLPDGSSTWTDWSVATSVSASPFTLDLLHGDGIYEMDSRAIDEAGNQEAASVADATVRLDTAPPASSIDPLPGQTSSDPIDVFFAAVDSGSGVETVEVWWRFRSTEPDPWSEWQLGASGETSPLGFTFGSGAGLYEFYSVAIDGAGNREEPPTVADAATEYAPTSVEAEVTKTFSFTSGLDGWTGSGTNCTSQHVPGDGVPAGSLATTVSGKNKTATCLWQSPLVSWQALGVPFGATVTEVRLESAATRLATCSSCQAGINGYRLQGESGAPIAVLWAGRPLPTASEPWQTTPPQADQPVPSAWQPAASQVRLVLDATLRTGNPGSSTVSLRQDEVMMVITYQPSPCGQAPSVAAEVTLQDGHPFLNIVGSGSATSSACPVAVDYRIQQYSWDTCQYTLVQDWTPATPADGAFDENAEYFDFSSDPVLPTVYTDHYLVDVRATTGGLSTTEQYAVSANPGQPSC